MATGSKRVGFTGQAHANDLGLIDMKGHVSESDAAALRERIEHAELSDVPLCLTHFRAHDACFLSVSCDVLATTGALPAWLLGPEAAPCACGVDPGHGAFGKTVRR